jgi:hypothetical protein
MNWLFPMAQTSFWDQIGGFGWLVDSLILLILAIAGALAIRYLRRWVAQPEIPISGGFTLGDLRKLHQEGKMTDEEFKKASELVAKAMRARMLAESTKKPTEQKTGGPTRPGSL